MPRLTTPLIMVVLISSIASVDPALSQWIVEDPAAIAQAAATFTKTVEQLENQVVQMQRDFEYMTKQLQSLGQLGWQDSYKLHKHIQFFDNLKGRINTLTFDYKQIDNNFRKLYTGKEKPIETRLNEWNAQTENSALAAMRSHGAIDDSKRKMESVSSLLEKQRKAQGDLAAIQTLGELSGIHAQQLEELKTIVALDSRAKQSQIMEDKARGQAGAEREKYLLKDFNKSKRSKPMRKLPKLGQGVEGR